MISKNIKQKIIFDVFQEFAAYFEVDNPNTYFRRLSLNKLTSAATLMDDFYTIEQMLAIPPIYYRVDSTQERFHMSVNELLDLIESTYKPTLEQLMDNLDYAINEHIYKKTRAVGHTYIDAKNTVHLSAKVIKLNKAIEILKVKHHHYST